jgi:hypothetical protein
MTKYLYDVTLIGEFTREDTAQWEIDAYFPRVDSALLEAGWDADVEYDLEPAAYAFGDDIPEDPNMVGTIVLKGKALGRNQKNAIEHAKELVEAALDGSNVCYAFSTLKWS